MLRMASKVCEWEKVVDVGCGNQQLKPIIFKMNPAAEYIGIDYLNHCKDTLVADFNKGEYPAVGADIAVLSGVIEYIYPEMLELFFRNVCSTAPVVVLSYWSIDYLQDEIWWANGRRVRFESWVNHLRIADIISLFCVNGFTIEEIKRYRDSSQYLMVFKKSTIN